MPYGKNVLRTNYRTTGTELDIDAIGGGFFQGSGQLGSGNDNRWWGGFVVFSFNDHTGSDTDRQSVADSCFWISAPDVFTSYYDRARGSLTGFKIIPVDVALRYCSGRIGKANMQWSVSDSLMMFKLGSSTVSACISTVSAHFIVTGFIASGP